MRKLIYSINTTLDGCCDHTKFTPDEETYNYYIHLLQDVDTLVYGRKTYELMVPYWPDIVKNHSGNTDEEIAFAQAFDAINNIIVFSQSLNKAEDKNTRIVHTNLKDEILALKQEPGKPILTGGVHLPSQLTALGLVDEYRIVVHPIIIGKRIRLFEDIDLPGKLPLQLVETTVFKSGCVALRYLNASGLTEL